MFYLQTKNLQEPVALQNLPTLRQSFVVASVIIILGYVLGALVDPRFEFLPLLVAGGLMFAGVTGVCPMVMLVQKMPWNRNK
ncbi:MAG: hypothetical protein RLZZ230_22 [Candidatus Parcubacteria bacterium]|jgi:hypothetical protein